MEVVLRIKVNRVRKYTPRRVYAALLDDHAGVKSQESRVKIQVSSAAHLFPWMQSRFSTPSTVAPGLDCPCQRRSLRQRCIWKRQVLAVQAFHGGRRIGDTNAYTLEQSACCLVLVEVSGGGARWKRVMDTVTVRIISRDRIALHMSKGSQVAAQSGGDGCLACKVTWCQQR
ncbi:hypothetical protein T440DRAFT_95417 [Plenodomus tracheiphilus IPT5]|uniref:Uncharacterized protein n=1 Tax=Plenodomus tracheiphilus IPT5 TaxID=1408161 RepID=A0A6A7BKH0_9PLEO|nr:hypothetical protein T440DRAFT_95417 [Plenodomus tracheiphilus IPT5]